jgi:hypothetical protein
MVIAGHVVVRGLSRFDSDAGVVPVKLLGVQLQEHAIAATGDGASRSRTTAAVVIRLAPPCNKASIAAMPRPMGRPAAEKITFMMLALAATASVALAEGRPTRFWNLTRHTISELYLAPAGTTDFGPNQCKNDRDGTIDPDERLPITGVSPGTYDAKLKDVSGRSCLVRNIKVEAGQIFSIEEKELTSCTR